MIDIRRLFQAAVYGATSVICLAAVGWAKPLTITDAVTLAMRNSPVVSSSSAVIDEARAKKLQQVSLRPPSLSVRWDNIPSELNPSDYKERRIGVTQDILFPMKYYWISRAADLKIEYAARLTKQGCAGLVKEVREAYLEAWFLREKVYVFRELSDSLKLYAECMQIEASQGKIPVLKAGEYRSLSLKTEADLGVAEARAIKALSELSVLVGEANDEYELSSPLESDPIDETLFDSVDWVDSDPDVLVDRSELEAARMDCYIAQRSWLPDFELSYFHRREIGRTRPNNWAFQVEATLPLWFWWEGRGKIQEANAKLRRIEAEVAEEEAQSQARVAPRLEVIRSLQRQLTICRTMLVPYAEELCLAIGKSFVLGAAGYDDLADARIDWKKAKLDCLTAEYELYRAWLSSGVQFD